MANDRNVIKHKIWSIIIKNNSITIIIITTILKRNITKILRKSINITIGRFLNIKINRRIKRNININIKRNIVNRIRNRRFEKVKKINRSWIYRCYF